MKKVLVIGANGRTGRLIMDQLAETTWLPIAGVRTEQQRQNFTTNKLTSRLIDVTASISQLKKQFVDLDAIIYAASGGILVDLDGKVKVAQAAESLGIKRFILISAGGIQHFHDASHLEWMGQWAEYSASMYYGDWFIAHSQLDYTIIRPENLIDTPGNGLVTLGDYLPHHNVSRANVAAITVASLLDSRTIHQAFDVEDGKTPIADALNAILEVIK